MFTPVREKFANHRRVDHQLKFSREKKHAGRWSAIIQKRPRFNTSARVLSHVRSRPSSSRAIDFSYGVPSPGHISIRLISRRWSRLNRCLHGRYLIPATDDKHAGITANTISPFVIRAIFLPAAKIGARPRPRLSWKSPFSMFSRASSMHLHTSRQFPLSKLSCHEFAALHSAELQFSPLSRVFFLFFNFFLLPSTQFNNPRVVIRKGAVVRWRGNHFILYFFFFFFFFWNVNIVDIYETSWSRLSKQSKVFKNILRFHFSKGFWYF